MTNLREAAQQALAFTMRDFASLRDFEASKAVLHDNLRAALAQPAEPVEPVEPVAWLVMDESGYVQHAASWRDAAHEHINDAINEHDLVCARTWRVVPVYTAPPRCPNCASLEAQNTELDRKLAELEQAYQSGYNAGVAHEREACAQVCEHQPHWVACAAAIRARSKE